MLYLPLNQRIKTFLSLFLSKASFQRPNENKLEGPRLFILIEHRERRRVQSQAENKGAAGTKARRVRGQAAWCPHRLQRPQHGRAAALAQSQIRFCSRAHRTEYITPTDRTTIGRAFVRAGARRFRAFQSSTHLPYTRLTFGIWVCFSGLTSGLDQLRPCGPDESGEIQMKNLLQRLSDIVDQPRRV